MNEEKIKEIERELLNFRGTEQYHKLTFTGLKGTDGIAFLCKEFNCFWLMDIVGSVMNKTMNEGFIVWLIEKKGSGFKVSAWTDTPYDEESQLIYSQKGSYTDFPINKYEFYQVGDVVMLKGEY